MIEQSLPPHLPRRRNACPSHAPAPHPVGPDGFGVEQDCRGARFHTPSPLTDEFIMRIVNRSNLKVSFSVESAPGPDPGRPYRTGATIIPGSAGWFDLSVRGYNTRRSADLSYRMVP